MEMFDWIGTTDQLSYTTMPIVSAIMTQDVTANRTFRSYNVQNNNKTAVQIRNETILAILEGRSMYDRLLYDWVAQTYALPQESLS
eukprot:scaffold34646_cov173-Amphora_coffeaeformis.AAC.19